MQKDIQTAFFAVAEGIREVFLDDNATVEERFLCQIGDSEPSAADGALHPVTMEQGAIRQFLGRNRAIDNLFCRGFVQRGHGLGVGHHGFLAGRSQYAFHEVTCRAAQHA